MAKQNDISKYLNDLETINELLDRVDPQQKIYQETKSRAKELKEIITSLPSTSPSSENETSFPDKKTK